MDESTSALDESTASTINTYNFGDDTTVLIIAHRIHSFLHCNRVVVMAEGEIIQNDKMGDALINKEKPFYQMMTTDVG